MVSKKEDKKSKDLRNAAQDMQEVKVQSQGVRSILHIPKCADLKQSHVCGGLTYTIFGALTIILAIVAIVVSLLGAIAQKHFVSLHSGRVIAMILLAVIAAVTIGLVAYSFVGIRKKHTKPLFSAAIALAVLILLQALIVGLGVYITQHDEEKIVQDLIHTFLGSREGVQDQIKYWNTVQSEIGCCGVYSPEDYRNPGVPMVFPPNVAASCCPVYRDNWQSKSNSTRERDREICKANFQFYKVGCKKEILGIALTTSTGVIIVTAVLIVAEIVVAILAGYLSSKRKLEKQENIDVDDSQNNPKQPNAPNTHNGSIK